MSAKINDGLTRSSRTRAKRKALGLCPDCGGTYNIIKTRCFSCRYNRNMKWKERNKKEKNASNSRLS